MGDVHRVQFSEIPFAKLQELHDRLSDLIFEYEGEVPLAGVLGVLRILEHTVLQKSAYDHDL